jgi:hypothetical protein
LVFFPHYKVSLHWVLCPTFEFNFNTYPVLTSKKMLQPDFFTLNFSRTNNFRYDYVDKVLFSFSFDLPKMRPCVFGFRSIHFIYSHSIFIFVLCQSLSSTSNMDICLFVKYLIGWEIWVTETVSDQIHFPFLRSITCQALKICKADLVHFTKLK